MSAQIDFTDFIMSRYARKESMRGHMIARLKQAVVSGNEPIRILHEFISNAANHLDNAVVAKSILEDWEKEQKLIERERSKVQKYVPTTRTSSILPDFGIPHNFIELPNSINSIQVDTDLTFDLGAFYEECFG